MNEMHEELKTKTAKAIYDRNQASIAEHAPWAKDLQRGWTDLDSYDRLHWVNLAQTVIEALGLSARKFRDKDGTFVIVSGKWDA